ncbi:MAG: hypothetical protein IPM97_12440 [Bdellovibrionaceae bacterium]|nr:hypothetical protein [Pseudobdellovibrionaceae bacterium]
MDIGFISAEAKTLHSFFVSMFYMLSTILLLIGVLLEYFKMPVGGPLEAKTNKRLFDSNPKYPRPAPGDFL